MLHGHRIPIPGFPSYIMAMARIRYRSVASMVFLWSIWAVILMWHLKSTNDCWIFIIMIIFWQQKLFRKILKVLPIFLYLHHIQLLAQLIRENFILYASVV